MSMPVIPGYEVTELVGRGGMGRVYRATDLRLGRTVAIKMLVDSDDPELLARFESEAKAVASLSHPNITRLFEFSRNDAGQPYCVMEFMGGGTLADFTVGRPMLPKHAAEILITLAGAIDAAHREGILHRDLKPANILIAGAPKLQSGPPTHTSAETIGKTHSTAVDLKSTSPVTPSLQLAETEALPATLRISDFGLARRIASDSHLTRTGQILGTPAYMAPEQASGMVQRPGPGVDIYSLGAIFFELLTGRPPFLGADSLETVMLLLSEDPPPPRSLQPSVPLDLQTICLKCLEKKPSRRYVTAAELADDITRFQKGLPILAKPASTVERCRKWAARNPWKAAAIGLFAASGIAASIGVVALLGAYRDVKSKNDELFVANRHLVEANSAAKEARDLTRDSLDQIVDRLRDGLYDVPQATKLMLETSTESVNLHRRLYRLQPDDFGIGHSFVNSLYSHAYFEWLHGSHEQSRTSGKELEATLEVLISLFPERSSLKILRLKTILNRVGYSDGDNLHPSISGNQTLDVEHSIRDLLIEKPAEPEILKLASKFSEWQMNAAAEAGKIDDYVAAARERVDFSRRYFVAESGESQKAEAAIWLAHARRVLAQGLTAVSEINSAATVLEEAIREIRLISPVHENRSLRYERAQLCFEMARIHEKLGDPDAAVRSYAETISLFLRLVKDHPDDITYRSPMAVALIRSAALSHADGNSVVAMEQLTAAEMHVGELLKLEPDNAEAQTFANAIPGFLAQIRATLPKADPLPIPAVAQ